VKLLGSRRRLVLFAGAVLLLTLFVFRPGANGLRKRIVNSVSLALGRRVEVQWVKLRILPQPGFELENFIVYDDPSFSAEPMLRASEVTATLRLRSLLRGRLEIGRLSLKEPSFNLMRSDGGHWNLESLLERAAHTPTAPTANVKPEARPVFPYIEADNGRINFKIGQEKKAYALTDADFALWLGSDNKWSMRLRAQPVRTDFNLSDTGTLRVNGSWQRSQKLRSTPLNFTIRWEQAQLGQFTKLIYGNDRGWRGSLGITAVLVGTPESLSVKLDSSVQDFRRYDIVPPDSMRLAASCTGQYSSTDHLLSELVCQSPVGKGRLKVIGSIGAPTGPRSYNLRLVAHDLPVQAIASLARRAKKDLPGDLAAIGVVNGEFALRSTGEQSSALQWSGSGEIANLHLTSETVETELAFDRIPFALISDNQTGAGRVAAKNIKKRLFANADATYVDVGPFPLSLGKSYSTNVHGWIGKSGYGFSVQGEGSVQRLLLAARLLGLRTPEPTADGMTKLDLQVAGGWSGFAAPLVNGTAQLHDVRTEWRSLDGPIEITSATVSLSENGIQVQKLAAKAAGTLWGGSLSLPRQCSALATCPLHFDLQADSLDYEQLRDWLNPRPRKRPWYRFLSPGVQPGPMLLSALNASGSIRADKLEIRDFSADHVSAQVEVRDGEVRLSDLAADLLGGKHHGDWKINFSGSVPEFSGSGSVQRASLAQLAVAMHDGWITGTGNGTYRFSGHGNPSEDWLTGTTGTLHFEIRDGVLPHIALANGDSPLRVRSFAGRLTLQHGLFELQDGKLETPAGLYLVSGTASPGQRIDIQLARGGARGFNVTGTLSAPRVVPATFPETRAELKP
jgi:AsmA-like C-terminal region/AsmA family